MKLKTKISYIILAIIFVIITVLFFTAKDKVKSFSKMEYHYWDRFKTVVYGKYEQDNNKENGEEPIEWYVLDEDDENALLITKNAIVCITYHDRDSNIIWEHSILRLYLNMVFYEDYFTEDEKNSIILTKNDNSPSKFTEDHIFVLSVDEFERYFKNDSERMAHGTESTKAIGLSVISTMPTVENPIEEAAYCWTRTKGYKQSDVACVNFDGHINRYGYNCFTGGMGVRPCMWVRKDKLWKN